MNKKNNLIFLVRHGESVSNAIIHNQLFVSSKARKQALNAHGNPELTTIGHQQATETAKELYEKVKDYKGVLIYVSPLTRTNQTAHAFVKLCEDKKFVHHVSYDPSLQEYTTPAKNITGIKTCLGGKLLVDKTWSLFTERVINNVPSMREQQDLPIVIFGHSQYFSVLLSYIASGEEHRVPDKQKIAHHLPNCAISAISYHYDHWRIYYSNSVTHLPLSLQTGTHL